MAPLLRYFPLLFLSTLPVLEAATVLLNGGFTGSLASWTTTGTLFNTGDSAVFSDSVASPVSIFQSGAVTAGIGGMELTFDFLNSLSPAVPGGFLADSFFATLYLGASPFGPSLAGGLFDLDSSGAFNIVPGATFGPSPKGASWIRFNLAQAAFPAFSAPGVATISANLGR